MYLAGEALSLTPNMLRFVQLHPYCRFFNHYGPTETHVATVCEFTKRDCEGPVPIGLPIANTQSYILTGRQLTPDGCIGELYIGGDGLAREYFCRPELTEQRFIDNPFKPGLMYKTGDLVRFDSNGQIEFIGRTDDQVKFRGSELNWER
ncbi:hypothetical protein AC626_23490 [Pseudoalteromonas rubra]|uniref:AMP-dependent synthetase/ligase domain-containing protein n=1 Tax=Pseudoalteromonas rubra TaxID=43658 RepID=A0A0L0ELP1_9GAMM|nr:hypothetical protein AC626_23490 [Pseudoalteromonas rubra]